MYYIYMNAKNHIILSSKPLNMVLIARVENLNNLESLIGPLLERPSICGRYSIPDDNLTFETQAELAQYLGTNPQSINRALKRNWRIKGKKIVDMHSSASHT